MKDSFFEKSLKWYAHGCALLLTGSMLILFGFLLFKGWKSINSALIFADTPPLEALLLKRQVFNGLFPAMVGTVCLILLSMGIAIPVGLASGIFMAEYAPSKIKWFFSLIFDILAGIPSIVVGLFGLATTLFLHHTFNNAIFPCLLISALCLAFLVLPYMIRTSQIALESLPMQIRLTAVSLGATKAENILKVLLPASMSNIVSGIILAMGRCAEDTAVIMLTGAVATAGVPKSIFSSFEALPFYIYYTASEYSSQTQLLTGYGAAIILLVICGCLFTISHLIKRQF